MSADVLGSVLAVGAFGTTAIVLALLWRRDSVLLAIANVERDAAKQLAQDKTAALESEQEANRELVEAYREAGVDSRRVLAALAKRRVRPHTDGDDPGGDVVHRAEDDATPPGTPVRGRTGSRGVLAGRGGAAGGGLSDPSGGRAGEDPPVR